MTHRTSNLTEREREVLRLVHALKTSTQIAHDLQIAEVSVNKRIDSARRKLGGISRRQAALLLAQEEQGDGYEKLIPAEIVLTANRIHRAQDALEQAMAEPGGWDPTAVASPRRGPRNALDLWQRVGVIFLSMAGLAIAASLYIAVLRLH